MKYYNALALSTLYEEVLLTKTTIYTDLYIYIVSYIIYYIFPLAEIIILAIKAVGFSKFRQTLSAIFAYGGIKQGGKKMVSSSEPEN